MVIFPLLCTGISLLCAWTLGRDAFRRPRPEKVIWTAAFVMFALAAGADAVGRELGWSIWLAKLYYATGPVLVVTFLAIGELYLLGAAWMKRYGVGLTVLLTLFWLSLVLGAPVDENRLAVRGWDAIEREGFITVVAIVINTVATCILVGGTAYTAWRFAREGIMPNRMAGCLWILAGTLFVAAGGSLTRLGHYEYLYIAMSIGVGMIFYGVLWTRRPEKRSADGAAVTLPVAPQATTVLPMPRTQSHSDHNQAALAFVEVLLRMPVEEMSRACAEWSVPADDTSVLSRSDARGAWVFRQALPEQSQIQFDALPVPVRRQLATLYREILMWDRHHSVASSCPNGANVIHASSGGIGHVPNQTVGGGSTSGSAGEPHRAS